MGADLRRRYDSGDRLHDFAIDHEPGLRGANTGRRSEAWCVGRQYRCGNCGTGLPLLRLPAIEKRAAARGVMPSLLMRHRLYLLPARAFLMHPIARHTEVKDEWTQ